MPAVAALTDGRAPLAALKRAVPRSGLRVVACKSLDQVRALLARRLTEAVVVSPRLVPFAGLYSLAKDYPTIPVIGYAAFRADDGELLHACATQLRIPVAVEGVDEALLGELVARAGATALRRRALSDAPRLLRLRTELQREVWDLTLALAHAPLRAGQLARKLGMSREHLSREFALEAAPNLKRVIDLARVVTAAHLLQNPGCTATAAARMLGFASASHLGTTARRIAGTGAAGLAPLGPHGVLVAFARGRTRSRL
ncbi:MAG TPA: helix-turn-helix domain-containing protein [Gemmatimonadales bacterium]|nr:helix-turn-helix domain-containing protein [Gemmatimonadales bacterium]